MSINKLANDVTTRVMQKLALSMPTGKQMLGAGAGAAGLAALAHYLMGGADPLTMGDMISGGIKTGLEDIANSTAVTQFGRQVGDSLDAIAGAGKSAPSFNDVLARLGISGASMLAGDDAATASLRAMSPGTAATGHLAGYLYDNPLDAIDKTLKSTSYGKSVLDSAGALGSRASELGNKALGLLSNLK